jgi:hypothetical protein
MSWLQPKRFAFSTAEIKGDDYADARWTAVGFTFSPVFCLRRAGCEMKRGGYSLRRSARLVESTSSSNRTPAYTTYILLLYRFMIISTDAQIINAFHPVVAANALPSCAMPSIITAVSTRRGRSRQIIHREPMGVLLSRVMLI